MISAIVKTVETLLKAHFILLVYGSMCAKLSQRKRKVGDTEGSGGLRTDETDSEDQRAQGSCSTPTMRNQRDARDQAGATGQMACRIEKPSETCPYYTVHVPALGYGSEQISIIAYGNGRISVKAEGDAHSSLQPGFTLNAELPGPIDVTSGLAELWRGYLVVKFMPRESKSELPKFKDSWWHSHFLVRAEIIPTVKQKSTSNS
eukprot:jgi/Chlat1/9193/Chrsp97S08406